MWLNPAFQNLKIVALDNNAADILNPAWLAEYIDYLGTTYPAGLEIDTFTYSEIEGIYDGSNPFPVQIVIDKNGVMQYIAREYDFSALEAAILPLL